MSAPSIDESRLRYRWDFPLLLVFVVLNIALVAGVLWLATAEAEWLKAHPAIAKQVDRFRTGAIVAILGIPALVFLRNGRHALVRGNSVLLSRTQIPEIYSIFEQHCDRLGFDRPPELYMTDRAISHPCRAYSSFQKNYVVLRADFLQSDVNVTRDVISFLLGYELGRIRLDHTAWWDEALLSHIRYVPVLRNPLLHVRTYAADRYGAALTPGTLTALLAHASGRRMLHTVDGEEFRQQVGGYHGFWARLTSLAHERPPIAYRIQTLASAGLLSPGSSTHVSSAAHQ